MRRQISKNLKFLNKINIAFSCRGLSFIVIAIFLFTAPCLALAQPSAPPVVDPDKRMSELEKQLHLNTEQKEKMAHLLAEESEKRRAVFDKYASEGFFGFRKIRRTMEALDKEFIPRYAEFLTPEQMKKFEDLREVKKKEMRKRGRF